MPSGASPSASGVSPLPDSSSRNPTNLSGLSGAACRRARAACVPAVSRRLQKMQPGASPFPLLLPPSTPPRTPTDHARTATAVLISEEASQSPAPGDPRSPGQLAFNVVVNADCCTPAFGSPHRQMSEQSYTVASDSETTGEDKSQPSFPDVAIGIDIGTSKCSVAVWNGHQVELLKNTRNQKGMRSYVMFKDDNLSAGVTGGAARENAHEERDILSGSAIFNMKRLIGRMDTDEVVQASKALPFLVQTLGIGVRPFIAALVNNMWRSTTPEEVLAIFLLELKALVEMHLKHPVRNAVLTIPVAFSRFQQTRIERACAMAGLHVLRLMPEPTAVALLYAQQQQQLMHDNMGSGIEKIALIFNMGAGYCDVAVAATAGGVSQIRALAGCTVGGEDILQNIMRHVLPNFDSLYAGQTLDRIRSMGLLRIATQDAIHRLANQDTVEINVDLGNGHKVSKVLDHSEFEQVNRAIFEKCEKIINQCLLDAKLVPEDVNDVILVGGCSRIPRIRSLVLGLCKKEVSYKNIEALEAAVSGAALEGAIASGVTDPSGSLDLLTIQATPMNLGIRADGDNFAAIIPRNTTVPARRDMLFTTTHDNQTEALIAVYEGEGEHAEDNHLLGYFKITGIPPAPKGSVEISVCMDIDAANVLRVFAGVVKPQGPAIPPFIEVRMPTLDDGHGWCGQALAKIRMNVARVPSFQSLKQARRENVL
ncbi:heat shock 70 kDa protein 8 [Panicum miliaceum]|uniref:Heat shock 70 kDa protein 8 n=1 Tax=Panicum miliaceum TaxID=4540 RepID=A0A3L6TKV6_PANMI|nr:heat shock 70 kDa protein 8 [Panicum miliaceum]